MATDRAGIRFRYDSTALLYHVSPSPRKKITIFNLPRVYTLGRKSCTKLYNLPFESHIFLSPGDMPIATVLKASYLLLTLHKFLPFQFHFPLIFPLSPPFFFTFSPNHITPPPKKRFLRVKKITGQNFPKDGGGGIFEYTLHIHPWGTCIFL